ncbi:DUF3261 domain-containing protein [Pseudoalteromonas sp. BSi20495]|uniref:DUF3261 domain-containing protein n=1 Tax=Pseudoalteromonas sp. BSi20495 TaxID=386429 RepID=UPI0002315439|nr:DUF3261 domain-containing protein [Pseudoalteromonas sp. BSi20495]GAA80320.1 hypothetical protein P20495_2834 [Pseudoalteromonas sp. BSi20495]
MSKLIKYAVCIVFIFAVLSACTSFTASKNRVYLSPNIQLNINSVPTQMFGQSWQHVLYITNQHKQHTVFAQLAINGSGSIKLLLMTVQGFPIMELEKPLNGPVKTRKMLAVEGIDPHYILADIALVHWPVAFLQKQLEGALIEQVGSNREVFNDEGIFITIDYSDESTTLNNILHQYQITFKKVEQ